MAVRRIATKDFGTEVLEHGSPVVVLFEADWCPFCTSFLPIIERRADEIPLPILAVLLNDYDDPLWDRFSVEVVPSLAVFDRGEIVFRIDGVLGAGLKDVDVLRLIEYLESLELGKRTEE